MNLYLAGCYTTGFHKHGTSYNRCSDREREVRDSAPYLLESYHYVHKQSIVDKLRRDGLPVFIDSGAFSAFTKGVKVNLPEYCRWLQKNIDIVRFEDGVMIASVLDGIGDPEMTLINQKEMEKHGVRPLPCFHYNEPWHYLEHYIANYEYITLGGMVPISTPQLFHWLDTVWSKYLTDGSGRPRLKVHGFGLTSPQLMERYPWWSVDSSSWVQYAVNGWIFTVDHSSLLISALSPGRKKEWQHFDTLPPMQQNIIRQVIEGAGFVVEELRNDHLHRLTFNMWSFMEMNKKLNLKDYSFHLEMDGLFE